MTPTYFNLISQEFDFLKFKFGWCYAAGKPDLMLPSSAFFYTNFTPYSEIVYPLIKEIRSNGEAGHNHLLNLQELLNTPNFIRRYKRDNVMLADVYWGIIAEKLESVVKILCTAASVSFERLSRMHDERDDMYLKKRTLTPYEEVQYSALVEKWRLEESSKRDISQLQTENGVSKQAREQIFPNVFEDLFISPYNDKRFADRLVSILERCRGKDTNPWQGHKGWARIFYDYLIEKKVIYNYSVIPETKFVRKQDASRLFARRFEGLAENILSAKLSLARIGDSEIEKFKNAIDREIISLNNKCKTTK